MTLDIMMPFYGRFDHFQEAVASVLSQSDTDWRLTILDDVYPDQGPGEWATAIDDSRVTYLRNEHNLRPSRNYNKAVGLARSTFVVIMGCDDVMLPDFVATVNRLIQEFPDADVIQPGVSVIDDKGAPFRSLPDVVKRWYRPGGPGQAVLEGEKLAVSLLRGNWTYFPSLVWRTDRLTKGFRTDLDVVQDLAMLLDIAKGGGRLVVDHSVVFNYRRHSGSVSSVTGPDGSKFRQERLLFGETAVDCKSMGWRRAARVARWHLSSRLNALSELPGAIRFGAPADRRALMHHVLGTSRQSAENQAGAR